MHDLAPISLYNHTIITSHCISDHKNCGQKKTRKTMVRRAPMLGQGSACTRGGAGGGGDWYQAVSIPHLVHCLQDGSCPKLSQCRSPSP